MEPQGHKGRIPLRHDRSIAGLYDMERSLGSGHFAVVKLAKHVFTGEKVAVKVIDKTKLDDVEKDHLYKEVRCMKLVQHPNVVRLYEVIDTQSKLYLILEYGDGGDMYDHIMKHEGQGISEEKAQHYFKQIVSAIDYCHKLHVVHRDLKPENVIFFKSQDLAKLTDFGFSNNFLPGEKLYTSCGSLAYSAPEILLGDSYDAPAVDIWSLGVILYMMVCGHGPFSHANDSETLTMIMDCNYDLPDSLSDECKRLISRMLVRVPNKRASLDSIVNDLWVNGGDSNKKSISPAPLISEISISKDIHISVLQKMEMGKIASKEEVEKSLQEDKYDHITATYFLIAERLLKKRHGFTALHVKLEERHSYPYEYIPNRDRSDTEIRENHTPDIGASFSKNTSYVASGYHHDHYPLTNDLTKEQSLSDECLSENSGSYNAEYTGKPLQRGAHRLTYPFSKVRSTPDLLNEITEEQESELEDSPKNSPMLQRRASQRHRPKYHSCRGLSPIHSRRSSCSSSDDDEIQMLSDKRRIASLSGGTRQYSAPPTAQQHQSSQQQQEEMEDMDQNHKHIRNLANFNRLDQKMLSLFCTDLENDTKISDLLSPDVSLKLSGLTKFTYGRHFSDTNLTSYSMHLRLAIAKSNCKNDKSFQYKCSSDTNLAKTRNKKKHLLITPELLHPKEFLKYIKRSRCSKTSSSLSLSSPIEEEEPVESKYAHSLVKDSNEPSKYFSDLRCDHVEEDRDRSSNNSFTSKNTFFQPVGTKYKTHEAVISESNLSELLPIQKFSAAYTDGSVCCSLV